MAGETQTNDQRNDMIQGYPADKVQTGERVMESPITDQKYLVTMWVEKGEDRVIALEKEEIDE